MNWNRQIRLTLFAALVQVVFHLRNVALLPILTRCLGPELYGLWGKMYALVGLLAMFVPLGTANGMRRYLPSARKQDRGRWFYNSLTVNCLIGVVVTGGVALLGGRLQALLSATGSGTDTYSVVIWLGLLASILALTRHIQSYFQFITKATVYGSLIFGQFVLLLSIALTGWGVLGQSLWVAFGAWGLASGIIVLIGLVIIFRDTAWRFDRGASWLMVRFGVPLLPGTALYWLAHFADRFMLGWLMPGLGDAGVGVYVANYALGGLISFIFGPFLVFVQPTATRLWDSGQVGEAAHLIRQTGKFALVLACPVIISTSFIGGELVCLVAGKDFVGRWPIMFLVMTGYLMMYLGYLTEIPLLMDSRTGRLMVHNLIVAAVNFFLNLIFIPLPGPLGGLTGAALATALSFTCYPILNLWADRKYGRSFFNWSAGGRCLVAVLFAVGLIGLIGVQSLGRLIVALVSAGFVYVVLLMILKVVRISELKAFAQEVGTMLKRKAQKA